MFSDSSLKWLTFWSFEPQSTSSVQKFNYLKAQLHAQGEAAKTIEGFPLSDRNYLHAVAILQDQFGQTNILIDAHMQALLELPKPNNSLHSLRSFHDAVESHICGLSSLGKSADTCGDLLVTIIQEKLPKDIIATTIQQYYSRTRTSWIHRESLWFISCCSCSLPISSSSQKLSNSSNTDSLWL